MNAKPDPEAYFRSNLIDEYYKRAGLRDRQIALRKGANEMLEEFRTPGGLAGSRLSNEWLGQHGWKIQMVPIIGLKLPEEELLGPLLPALGEFGVSEIIGGTFNAPLGEISPVWILEWAEENLDTFLNLHRTDYHMVWSEDRRFAIHGNDGDFDVYAGPEYLIRAALPPFLIGAAATRKNAEEIEWEHGPGSMDAVLEHYAPFMLDDD